MQLTKSLLVIAALGMITETSMASIEPYCGGGFEWSTANHRRGDSHGTLFNKYYGGANAYLGARWRDVSIEAGHESTGEKDKSASHIALSSQQEVVKAGIRLHNYFKSWHLDLNTYFPIYGDFELIGSLGYGAVKHKAHGGMTLLAADKVVLSERLYFPNQYKGAFRFGIGAEQMICDHIGIRGMIRYKLLDNRTRLKSDIFGVNEIVKYKNIISVSAGIIFKF